MKKYILYALVGLFAQLVSAQSTSIIGRWTTFDDESDVKTAKSIIEIYEQNGAYVGTIRELLKAKPDAICKNCEGALKNQKIMGMTILKDLKKDDDVYDDGTILDPNNGKTYSCKIWLDEDNPDLLHVRGYVAFFFRTQQWERVK